MLKKIKAAAFCMVLLFMASMFAAAVVAASEEAADAVASDVVAAAAEAVEPAAVYGTHKFNLALAGTGSDYSADNAKSNSRNYASIDIGYRTFELSPTRIYMSVCSDTSGTLRTDEIHPSVDGFALTYNSTVSSGSSCYLCLRTENRAANCSGSWVS